MTRTDGQHDARGRGIDLVRTHVHHDNLSQETDVEYGQQHVQPSKGEFTRKIKIMH